jgi:hypothetical protein
MRRGATQKGEHGARKLPTDTIREVLQDSRVWIKLGIVTKFDGETSHYELDGEDLLVDVELMPNREPVFCRMGTLGGGQFLGVWAIPGVGTEVLVAVPDGDLEMDPVIIACLSSGVMPGGAAAVDEQTLVISTNYVKIVAGGDVTIQSDQDIKINAAGNVVLGGDGTDPTQAGLVNGACVDSFTGTPYTALHSLSGKVTAPK